MKPSKKSSGYQMGSIPKQGDRNKPALNLNQEKDKAPLVQPAPNKK